MIVLLFFGGRVWFCRKIEWWSLLRLVIRGELWNVSCGDDVETRGLLKKSGGLSTKSWGLICGDCIAFNKKPGSLSRWFGDFSENRLFSLVIFLCFTKCRTITVRYECVEKEKCDLVFVKSDDFTLFLPWIGWTHLFFHEAKRTHWSRNRFVDEKKRNSEPN